jgi:RecB family exonuclease
LKNIGAWPKALLAAMKKAREDYHKERESWLKDWILNNGEYDMEISVTELTSPTRITALSNLHSREIKILEEENPQESWYSFMGTLMHKALELAEGDDPVSREVRMGKVIKVNGLDILIHGMADRVERTDGGVCIVDYKLSKTKSATKDSPEYALQLQMLGWLLNPSEKLSLYNLFLLRDWQDPRSMTWTSGSVGNGLPFIWVQHPVRDDIEKIIYSKVEALLKFDPLRDRCSPQDMWATPKWKAYSEKSSARAYAVAGSMDELKEKMLEKGKKIEAYLVKEVAGDPIRCSYCDAAPFCSQKKEREITNQNE